MKLLIIFPVINMFNGIGDREKRKLLIVFLYVAVAVMVYIVMRYVLYLAAPFIISLLIAFAVDKPVTWLNKKMKLPRAAGGVIVLFVIILFAGAGLGYVGYLAINELKAFAGNYGDYVGMINEGTFLLCDRIDHGLGITEGSTYRFIDGNIGDMLKKTGESITSFILGSSVDFTKKIFVWVAAVFISITAAVFMVHDFDKIRKIYREGSMSGGLNICFGKMFKFGIVFVRTQLIIMAITMSICTIGLVILKNPYAVLIGILIGLLDALPVFGTGTVLIPWTVIYLIMGRFTKAAVIFSVYLICYSIREVLEPHLMGNTLGIHPVIMLITMYSGVILFGVAGFILGPASYIVITEIMEYVKKVL